MNPRHHVFSLDKAYMPHFESSMKVDKNHKEIDVMSGVRFLSKDTTPSKKQVMQGTKIG